MFPPSFISSILVPCWSVWLELALMSFLWIGRSTWRRAETVLLVGERPLDLLVRGASKEI